MSIFLMYIVQNDVNILELLSRRGNAILNIWYILKNFRLLVFELHQKNNSISSILPKISHFFFENSTPKVEN